MSKYKVKQVYGSVARVRTGRKMAKPLVLDTIEAASCIEAIRIIAQRTSLPQLCLTAQLVKES
jgi:hypothetical protein